MGGRIDEILANGADKRGALERYVDSFPTSAELNASPPRDIKPGEDVGEYISAITKAAKAKITDGIKSDFALQKPAIEQRASGLRNGEPSEDIDKQARGYRYATNVLVPAVKERETGTVSREGVESSLALAGSSKGDMANLGEELTHTAREFGRRLEAAVQGPQRFQR